MNEKDDMQAFPHGDPTHGGDTGMTLRDYFAAKAMQSLSSVQWVYENVEYSAIAEMAYLQADAMLEERDK